MLTALPRLERIYRRIMDEQMNVDIDVIGVNDVDRCYAILRQIDWYGETYDRHIVLDFSTNRAVQKVLKQVGISVVAMRVQKSAMKKRSSVACLHTMWIVITVFYLSSKIISQSLQHL